jgi:hypothetical protein
MTLIYTASLWPSHVFIIYLTKFSLSDGSLSLMRLTVFMYVR